MNPNDKNGSLDSQSKKAYRSPVLQAYGNIRALTNSAGMTSTRADGMATGNTKTS